MWNSFIIGILQLNFKSMKLIPDFYIVNLFVMALCDVFFSIQYITEILFKRKIGLNLQCINNKPSIQILLHIKQNFRNPLLLVNYANIKLSVVSVN